MASRQFIVEFTEGKTRKREYVEVGNVAATTEQAERSIQRIWGGALPDRKDIKIVKVLGAGEIVRAPATPSTLHTKGDDALIAKTLNVTP
jgi:hypothetical protein